MLTELAISLYSQGILSFGKARQLANLDHHRFSQILGERKITRHYEEDDLEDDLSFASRE